MKAALFLVLFAVFNMSAMAEAEKSFGGKLGRALVATVKVPFKVATWRIKYKGEGYDCKFRPRIIRNSGGFLISNSFSLKGKCNLTENDSSFRVSALVKKNRTTKEIKLKSFKIKFKNIETDFGTDGNIPNTDEIRRIIRKGISKLSSKYEAVGCQIKTHKLRNQLLSKLDKKFKFSGFCKVDGQKVKVSTLIKISKQKLSMSNIKLNYKAN